jgi:uroporphyrin-3 C-methyltransferase
MLAEAEYLLRLANQRLVMEREITSPLALLKAADQILLTVDDVNLYPVRAELFKEITALGAVGRLDVEGIFLRLNALEQQVTTLDLMSPKTEAIEAASEPLNIQDDVLVILKSAWSRLLDQVRIRHRNKPVEPLLSPDQHQYIQQNLRLMMEQAQLALLQGRPGIYRQSLEKAEGWINTYFQLNGSTDALLASLKELKEINIAPELPDISPSLVLLKQYLTNPDILLEKKNGADAPVGQNSAKAPESGGS